MKKPLFSVYLQGKMQKISKYIILAFIPVFFACSDYNKVLKSKNPQVKYKKAMELYGKKDYLRAVGLFDQLRDIYKNSDSMETIYYYSAMSYFHLKDYQYASMFFKDFTDNFDKSHRLIECSYMSLYCDFLGIGSYELDQSETKHVMEALQTFTNYYPNSEYTQRCNEHLDILREKLQMKEYDHVQQYFKMGDYKSAVTSAKIAIKLFPDIIQREELEFLTVKAQYIYATNSIERKRKERFEEVLTNFDDYKYNNDKSSAHYQEALDYRNKAEKEIKLLKDLL